jgi:hypothetical protein
MIRPVDTTALASAYASFLAVAGSGGFGPPPEGEWPAELVVAHIVTNDRLLSAVTADLLAGGSPAYDNEPATLEANLSAAADAAGSFPALIVAARTGSEAFLQLVAHLDGSQADKAVHFRAIDAGVVTVDTPLPWARILDIHTNLHLPAHTAQLAALCAGHQ